MFQNFVKVPSGPTKTQLIIVLLLQARIAKELIELRNKSVFAFFMFNALFVLVVFLLQLNKNQIHVKWPLGIRTNITYIEETSEVFKGLSECCLLLWILDTNESLGLGLTILCDLI